MAQSEAGAEAAGRVSRAVTQTGSISILPGVAAVFFSRLLGSTNPSSSGVVAEIIESDPALCTDVFALLSRHLPALDVADFSLAQALGRIPVNVVRDAFVPVEVYCLFEGQSPRLERRKQLTLHSLAVACCARDIAEIARPRMDSRLAYTAGLLHGIGNFALDQAMPKSFERMVAEAQSRKVALDQVQQEHLGIDYAALGRRLALKWHMPSEIAMSVWLHKSKASAVLEDVPGAELARIVRLAVAVARRCGIGWSCSYDEVSDLEQSARSLGLEADRLERIAAGLADKVANKARVLGLDSTTAAADYCRVMKDATARLAGQHNELSLANRDLQSASSHFDFVTELFSEIEPSDTWLDVAEKIAVRWQKFYQTGRVCLYPGRAEPSGSIDAVLVEPLGRSSIVSIKAPADVPLIPEAVANKFAILDASEHTGWLFEQLDVGFEPRQARLVPLMCAGRTIGAIVFELRYPGDEKLFEQRFRAVSSLAGAALALALAAEQHRRLSERFAWLLEKFESPVESKDATTADQSPETTSGSNVVDALAEMAAGAAHELNNPLSVISGRAQLLAQGASDEQGKAALKQIQENAAEIAAIIDDLMAFAKPQPPRQTHVGIGQIIEEAVQLASRKMSVDHINVQTEIPEEVADVFVDSAQVASALANVLANSIESYEGDLGPVRISAAPEQSGDFVVLQVADLGCGMDAETLSKATQPFFSAKPAGRKRGMGLAHAVRLIELNGGKLSITSQPGQGTTVTVHLPCQ